MIDYSRPVCRDDIDFGVYERKFLEVDEWLASGVEFKNSDEGRLVYGRFLLDITQFAYLHFRIDGVPARLYAYQDLILNDSHRFKFFRSSNQVGKSIALDIKAARNIIRDHGHAHNEAIVSKSLPQATYQMRRVKGLLKSMPHIVWSEVKGSADSLSVISVDIKDVDGSVKYTNHLVCAPCLSLIHI